MTQADPLLGRVIGDRYRLTRAIGKGGFGAVYEAEHVSLDRHFAVKILQRHLDADPSFVQRFHREARLTSRLEHAHVIQVTDFGHDERLGTYFVMELLRGEDLQERIRRVGPMTSKTAVGVMRQIVDAFVYAHGKGVIHRDVKSANVFLVSDDTRTDFVKVLDLPWRPLYRVIRFQETRPEREPQPTEFVDLTRATHPSIHPSAPEDHPSAPERLACNLLKSPRSPERSGETRQGRSSSGERGRTPHWGPIRSSFRARPSGEI